MRIVPALFLILFVFSCSQAEKTDEAVVNGKTEMRNQWLYLVKPDPWKLKAEIIDSAEISADGNFKFSADIPDLREYLVSGRGFFISTVFLKNGFSLQMNIEGSGKEQSVNFEGEGAEISHFWKNMTDRFYQNGGFDRTYKEMVRDNEPLEFKNKWKAYADKQFAVLDSFEKAADPDPTFIDWAQSYVELSTGSKYYTYLYHKPRLTQGYGSFVTPPENYYEEIKRIELDPNPRFYHLALNDFIYSSLINQMMLSSASGNERYREAFTYAENNFEGLIKDMAASHVIKDLIQQASSRDDYELLRALMKKVKAWPVEEKFISFLSEQYNEKAVLAPGAPAPDFTLSSLNGEEVSLSDYKGKIVVIDFWGTWCGPCKRELPFSKKVEEHFAGRDDVVFLFVALERGPRANWEQFIKDNELPGVHLYTRNSSPDLAPYKITSVPRYAIIDKGGNVFDAFASRPSQNMQEQIEKALEL